MTRLFVIGAALLVMASEAAFGGCGEHAFYSHQKEDGTSVGLIATDADLARDPAWTPGRGEPPLSPARAYDLASAWAQANWKRFDSFGLENISLQRVGCDTSQKKWLYIVMLEPIIDGNRLFGSSYVVGVLMDGSIIPPKPVKNDF